jgi:Holliday junction resolvase-like predicted endonuclease
VVVSSDVVAPTSTIGAIGELLASAFFLRRGYYVFRSVTPNAPCDLIAVKGDRTLRVEVKTGREHTSGRINYSICSKNAPYADCVAAVHPNGEVSLFTLDRKPFILPDDEGVEE